MAATVLSSRRAVQMSVFVVRVPYACVKCLAKNRRLAAKLGELESHIDGHDTTIQQLIGAIKQLMAPEQPRGRKIGFRVSSLKRWRLQSQK